MYVSNQYHFGHLLEVSTYTTDHLHNDMYQMMDNRLVSIEYCITHTNYMY
jgi:lysyl hydroxylase/galactosyltransferase/glucosyltransferase/procollagen-lysine,2-oxoglutarate 5-dioxygenase